MSDPFLDDCTVVIGEMVAGMVVLFSFLNDPENENEFVFYGGIGATAVQWNTWEKPRGIKYIKFFQIIPTKQLNMILI